MDASTNMSAMPIQKPGKSKQCYGTPWSLIHAIEKRFCESIAWDLAALKDNAKAVSFDTDYPYFGPDHIHPEMRDSFTRDWHKVKGLLWLNCEYADIDPWAEKCRAEMKLGARIMFLTPASTGSNWFQQHIYRKAYIIYLKPRLVFEGETSPYPKDLILTYFCHGMKGDEIWDWKASLNGSQTSPGCPETSRKPKTAPRQPKGHIEAP